MKKNIYNFILGITIILICFFMFYWINQKEGYHEDEIFSYGSSNYKWDNVYQASNKSDAINRTVEQYVIGETFFDTFKNVRYFASHTDEFANLRTEIQKNDKPVWKTNQDAKEYATIQNGDALNYFSVYYNQTRDVHPPLFYLLVHLISTFFYGVFSKYIIFIINLIFILGVCFIIYKLFNLYNKKWLAIPTLLLYGLSMGAASTAIYLRMYAMLTFFCIAYLYLNLKFIKQGYKFSKNDKIYLFFTILLGFLTQYYFCVFVALVFFIIFIKNFRLLKDYILIHIGSAALGIILYPASIYHIFFSYRGVKNGGTDQSLFDSIIFYIKRVLDAYSINNLVIYIFIALLTVFCLSIFIYNIIVKKKKYMFIFEIILITIPTFLYLILISKLSPAIEAKYAIRYIMAMLPELAIIFVLSIYYIFKNKKIAYSILLLSVITFTINGFITNMPKYLYKGYNEYLKIANTYKDLDFIYTCDNGFTHINSIPEYLIYNKSLIININYDNLDFLENDQEILSQNEFILSIKKWTNVDEILNKVLTATGFSNYEILLDADDDIKSILYLIKK